jgi:hypothetical protein
LSDFFQSVVTTPCAKFKVCGVSLLDSKKMTFSASGYFIPESSLPLSQSEKEWIIIEAYNAFFTSIKHEIVKFLRGRLQPWDTAKKELVDKIERFNDDELDELVKLLNDSHHPPMPKFN